MTFGDLELTPLFDCHFRLDGGAMFGVVPKPLWEKRAPADERNRIRVAARPLLVRGEKTMIVDAGIGAKMDAKSTDIYAIDRTVNLDHSLARAGVRREDIDIVLASHLHFDHAGGFTTRVRRDRPGLSTRPLRDSERRMGRRHPSARTQPGQLPARRFRSSARGGRRRLHGG